MSMTLLPTAPSRRPLLSRVAESLFWLGRYVERAEQVARMLRVNAAMLTDVGDLAPELQQRQWQSIIRVAGVADIDQTAPDFGRRVMAYMSVDPLNPGSLVSSLSRARENARAVRSEISAEMWRCINEAYWGMQSPELKNQMDEQADDVFERALNYSMMFAGITDNTLAHDQRWLFVQLGRSLERAAMTCRIIENRYTLLQEMTPVLETPLRNIQWMALLRLCCSIEAYRRENAGDLKPIKVIEFLLLESGFPHSVLYNVDAASKAISEIRRITAPDALDPAERTLGRLRATLEFASADEIDRSGVVDYINKTQASILEAAMTVQQTYFMK